MSEHSPAAGSPFQSRLAAVQARVNAAALALHERNVRPTVARIRAALGGGSPNELAPAVRHWKDEVLPTLAPQSEAIGRVPPLIADLVHELWTRATAAAAVELTGGTTSRHSAARSEETRVLRDQLSRVRDQLQEHSIAYGELRAQGARHEAIAREALARVRETEDRERKSLHQLGEARQRVAELTATIEQLRKQPRPDPAGRTRPPKRLRKKAARKAAAVARPKPRKKLNAKPRSRAQSKPRKRR